MFDVLALDALLRGLPASTLKFDIILRFFDFETEWQAAAMKAVQWQVLASHVEALGIADRISIRIIGRVGEQAMRWDDEMREHVLDGMQLLRMDFTRESIWQPRIFL